MLPRMSRAPDGHAPTSPLSVRDYRLLFLAVVAGQAMMPMRFVTQIFWIQHVAPADTRVLLVGALAAVRGAGALPFGLIGGALADRFDRRRLLLASQACAVAVNLGIAAVMIRGRADLPTLAAFFALTFVAAAFSAVDTPTRQAMVPDVLGPQLAPAGFSLNSAGGQVSLPLSLFASGFVVDALGFSGAYAITVAGNVVVVAALLAMRYASPRARDVGEAAAVPRRSAGIAGILGNTAADVRSGFAYARGHGLVLGVITVTLLVSGLGQPAVANLGPTWITTVVGVPVRDFGWVAMGWGAGAFVASALLARRAMRIERWGRVLALGAIGFALSFVVFSVATVPTAVIGNIGLGAGIASTNVAAITLLQHLVPNEVRGRVFSILMLNQGLAQFVTFPLAAAGELVSLRVLYPVLAVTQVAVVGALLVAWPALRRATTGAAEARPAPASAGD